MENLHQKFVRLGRERNRITYELLALLPEIFEKKIYKKYGHDSIYEYAGKLAGLSFDVVRKTLNVSRFLENKPCLQKAIQTQGIHKVAIVATLAKPETDSAWADKIENMSKNSLQQLSKEMRGRKIKKTIIIEMDNELEFLLLKFKKEEKCKNNTDALKLALKKALQPTKQATKTAPRKKSSRISRYIPAGQRREALSKTEGRCAYGNCNKPAEHFHHINPFSKSKNHESIVPLCKEHHEFAHNGLIQDQNKEPRNWKLTLYGQPDLLFRRYRQVARAPT